MGSGIQAVDTRAAEVCRGIEMSDIYEETHHNTQATEPLGLDAESIAGVQLDSASLHFVVD